MELLKELNGKGLVKLGSGDGFIEVVKKGRYYDIKLSCLKRAVGINRRYRYYPDRQELLEIVLSDTTDKDSELVNSYVLQGRLEMMARQRDSFERLARHCHLKAHEHHNKGNTRLRRNYHRRGNWCSKRAYRLNKEIQAIRNR